MASQIFLFSVLLTVLIIDRYFLKKGAGNLKTELSLSNEGNYSSKRQINYQIKVNRLLLFLSVVLAGIFLTNHYLRFLPVEFFKVYTAQLGIAFNYILFCIVLAWTFSKRHFSEAKKNVATEILLFVSISIGFSIFSNQTTNYVRSITEERLEFEDNHLTMQYVDYRFVGYSIPENLKKLAMDLGFDFVDFKYYERLSSNSKSDYYNHILSRTLLPASFTAIILEKLLARRIVVDGSIFFEVRPGTLYKIMGLGLALAIASKCL